MKYFVLRQTGRVLFPLLLALSLFVLYRGHNLPGGGFIGGLIAAASFTLIGIGESMEKARRLLRIDPVVLMGLGLGVALFSSVFSFFASELYMTALWLPTFRVPFLGAVHLGTPLIFDVGVFLTVVGFVLHTTFSLAEISHVEGEEEQ